MRGHHYQDPDTIRTLIHPPPGGFLFLFANLNMKKNWFYIILIAGLALAFYEQSKPDPNVFVMALAVIAFMFGIMKLSSKIPSKHQEKHEDEV